MKIVIDKVSEIHGQYPGSVDVSFHYEVNGRADGFETKRVALSSQVIRDDGTVDSDQVTAEVENAIK